jgi:two-component system response regulator RegA
LLVDSDISYCDAMSAALAKYNFTVTLAHNLEDAMQFAMEHLPEYAVVGQTLGGESGLTLVNVLSALNPTSRIVVLSALSCVKSAVSAMKMGATNYLLKPVGASEIVAAFGVRANVMMA